MIRPKFKLKIKGMKVSEAFEEFLDAKLAGGASTETLRAYRCHFGAVSRFLDVKIPIEDLTDAALRRMVAQMAKTDLSRNSIRSYTATLHSFTSWMREEGICDAQIALFKGEESIPTTYSMDELKRLLKRPFRRCTFCELRNWTIVNLLVNNGCRAASVRAMQVKDVNLDQKVILLRHTKRRKAQAIPLSPALAEIFEDYLEIRRGDPEDALFPDSVGAFMSANCLRNAILRYNESRGVHTHSIHAFRHTFARLYLVECNGNALKLQRLLGHSTLDMTKKYVKLYDEDLIKDFQKTSPLSVIK